MTHYKHGIIAFFALVIIGSPWLVNMYPEGAKRIDSIYSYVGNNYTAVFLHEALTIKQLQSKYKTAGKSKNKPKVRVLIVPGHEPGFGGTSYKDVNERDIVVELSQYMKEFFENDKHYEVVVSRDRNGWNPDFQAYFGNNWNEIVAFVNKNKEEMFRLVNNGNVVRVSDTVIPNDAPQSIATRLYGINKWANENKIDVAIHVHFNDYPRRNSKVPGEYSGFSIYVPEKQYSNSTTTRAVASSVMNRLAKYNPVSDFLGESSGIVENQELIATGAYNTLDAPSILIEYAYIYEPQIVDSAIRESTVKDLAFQTYLGIQDFFGEKDRALAYDTLMLPYVWNGNLSKESDNKNEILALQTALIVEGLYPPHQKSKNDCPRTGTFGSCTIEALNSFQVRYGIQNENGIIGEETKKVLNSRYSIQLK